MKLYIEETVESPFLKPGRSLHTSDYRLFTRVFQYRISVLDHAGELGNHIVGWHDFLDMTWHTLVYTVYCIYKCWESPGAEPLSVQGILIRDPPCQPYTGRIEEHSRYCTVCSIHCPVCSAQCIIYNVQCTLYCTLSALHWTDRGTLWILYSLQSTVYSIQCAMYSVHCTV